MKRMLIIICPLVSLATGCGDNADAADTDPQTEATAERAASDAVINNATRLVRTGRKIFRYDTFGSEDFFGGQLRLHEAIAGRRLGGVGPGLSPEEALQLGLKVDIEALPDDILTQLEVGALDLTAPETTVALLELDAVIGLTGFSDERGGLAAVGVQCALCHSTVDDQAAPGIGRRLDGYANQDLDIGRIVALAPTLTPFEKLLGVDESAVRDVFKSWGPGKYDALLVLDGKAFRPDGETAAVLIPPAFRLGGVNLHTYTGMGSVTYWNAYVANTQMMGKGTFYDPRFDDEDLFPIAAKAGLGHIDGEIDRITAKLPALQLYQLSLPVPKARVGTYDSDAASRGRQTFNGRAQCNTCHVPPLYTEPGHNLHDPKDIGIDSFQADRSPEHGYRTSPLQGLHTHMKRGFYHDGRFKSLDEVVAHYDEHFKLELTRRERADLVEFLKSL